MVEPSQKAPDFRLEDQDGNTHQLSDYAGKKVILYFYPKDDTPGCTREAIEFTEFKKNFEDLNTVIIGVSKDSVDKHKKFCDKHQLKITLLSDKEPFITERYGVWQEKKNYGKTYMGIVRTTVLINESGIIQHVWENVKVNGHVEAVLKEIQNA